MNSLRKCRSDGPGSGHRRARFIGRPSQRRSLRSARSDGARTMQPRTAYQIFDIEMGIDGMMFSHREGVQNQKFTYMPGSELIVRSMKSMEDIPEGLSKMFGWWILICGETQNTAGWIRDQHFAESKRWRYGRTPVPRHARRTSCVAYGHENSANVGGWR